MSNSNITKLIIGVTIILLIAFGVGVYRSIDLTRSTVTEEDVSASASNNLAMTGFLVSPQVIFAEEGEQVDVAISIDTTEYVNAIDLNLSYDPEKFELVDTSQGDFFTNPLEFSKDIESGKIFYASGSTTPETGSGSLINISLISLEESNGVVPVIVETDPVVSFTDEEVEN